MQRIIAVLSVFLLLAPAHAAEPAADANARVAAHQITQPEGRFGWLTGNYRPAYVPPVDLANSNRLESLLRAGNLYLSLQDAIALALENNLDIEIQRYAPQIAEASLMRARAGGFARGVSTSVQTGASSATTSSTAQTGISSSAGSQTGQASSTAGSTVVTQTGSAIPNLDPVVVGSARWAHTSTPQTSAFVTGTNAFISRSDTSSVALQKGFLTGTSLSLNLSNQYLRTNNRSADFNPASNGTLGFNFTQRLLQGFGLAVNSRQITIAKNNREISDLTFKNQVITTVSAVMNLYWDLVSFNEDAHVRRQSLALAEKLYQDNRKQVEIGTLAPIEIVRAEAEMAARQQDLTISETQILQQETILKNALSRNGVASPGVADARIITLDRIQIPAVEPIAPIQDLAAQALASRPELAQSRMQLRNSEVSLKGSRSALLPTLDVVVNFANNGLAGQPNDLPVLPGRTRLQNEFFLGGYGSVLGQLLSRNFPDYSAGFNLNIPLRNRAAQADMINDQLAMRQQQLSLQRLENQVRVDVQNAMIALQQARARYQAAEKARVLQEQTLDAEQKKFALGASTMYNVILAQRDLATARSVEVAATNNYGTARVELDRATGQTLDRNNISMAEAVRGVVSQAPGRIPDLPPQQR
ncbi:MAG TPA: TolC family protein [Bryobacteraceae bacterium]|nr:TolC family protein [Bryobacteraceae bacterium]